jgi:hypothetical protein
MMAGIISVRAIGGDKYPILYVGSGVTSLKSDFVNKIAQQQTKVLL